MERISEEVKGANKIGIAGHVRPDGDCVGACTALYQYLTLYREELGIGQVDVYLEPFGKEFDCLTGADQIHHTYDADDIYDVFITLDSSSLDRLGNALKYFTTAKKTINIDHHVSNPFFAQINHVIVDASSTCEVLFTLMEEERITLQIAESLYVGIIHDTGVFKHSSTSPRTMNIAGKLMEKGINFSVLIDESFFAKTFMQNQILGRCLMESILVLDSKVVFASVGRRVLDFYGASSPDLDGIIDQLRITKGTEVAVFIYETGFREYKVSMRSNGEVNVSKIASYFGGGGHIKAAGCTMTGSEYDVINNLTPHIEAQLKEFNKL